ncbi:MAG: ABC transporter ATP-binding protein [Alphaproteobacteria bacterium]|nr:ABC transporter ATP-binding protein [Alphaproteobacteria bacterium]
MSRQLKAEAAVPAQQAGTRAAALFAARLTFEGVERRYGDFFALHHVDLDIAAGEVVCLLGPSGCGKTTLLRIASGIEKPSGGRVLINDREVAGPNAFVPPERRSVGLMFQDFALFPHLTILQNVAFGLKRMPLEEARREALAVLTRVGLQKLAEQYPHTLSGGQQQRVALARAIVPRPSVMMMDEPFSGLDVQLRDEMQEETLALLRETRATSLIVTHHPEEAMRLGDRIAVLRAGRVVQFDKAETLYDHPRDLLVARMFSEINEVTYKVLDGSIETPLGRLAAPKGMNSGELAVVCIRERGVEVSASGQGLPGRVLHVRFLGDIDLLEIGVQGFEAPLRVRTPHYAKWMKGAEVGIEVDPARLLVFPAVNEGSA